jgi:hypothetical protein
VIHGIYLSPFSRPNDHRLLKQLLQTQPLPQLAQAVGPLSRLLNLGRLRNPLPRDEAQQLLEETHPLLSAVEPGVLDEWTTSIAEGLCCDVILAHSPRVRRDPVLEALGGVRPVIVWDQIRGLRRAYKEFHAWTSA